MPLVLAFNGTHAQYFSRLPFVYYVSAWLSGWVHDRRKKL